MFHVKHYAKNYGRYHVPRETLRTLWLKTDKTTLSKNKHYAILQHQQPCASGKFERGDL